MDIKLYICSWGSGYPTAVKACMETWFTEEHGYDESARKQVRNLEPGQAVNVDQINNHAVMRVA